MDTLLPISHPAVRRNTEQKRLIMETLTALGGHAAAGEIFEELKKTHPNVGRATVFRVLSALSEDGIIQRILVAGGNDRFDVTVKPHCHILCRKCGRLADVWLKDDMNIPAQILSSSGYSVENVHLEFTGLCSRCREEETGENSRQI